MDLIRHDLAGLSYNDLLNRIAKEGGQRAAARKWGLPRTTIQFMLEKARIEQFKHRPAPTASVQSVPQGASVRRFILTSAQDSTKLHEGFLTNLEAYRDFLDDDEGPCEIMIAGFTYNKSLFEDHAKSKVVWHDRIKPYMRNERIRLCEMVDWCGEMNTLPTAETPLSGFETYTRHRWGIFPHAKVQLRSVPTMKHEPAKQIMTTGACTLPNYVPKRAGIKASFHHVIGAVIVEVRSDGKFFCRHLLAEDDGSFHDLDMRISGGEVDWRAHRVEAINWGDIHVAQIDPVVAEKCFGFAPIGVGDKREWQSFDGPTMLGSLNPRHQFLHDVADFQSRNHHNVHDPHLMFQLHVDQVESVESEMREVAMFITMLDQRIDGQTVVVESNHNQALTKWLKTADYRYDPKNARFFLQCQLAIYEAIEQGRKSFSIFEEIMRHAFDPWRCGDTRFLALDESYKLCGIEKGMHGHDGANGSRGSPQQFRRMGSKATTGHTHSCGIIDGIYTAGTTSKLDMGYNTGLSSWSHSHVVTYANGKRAIITMQDGLWKA